MHYRSAGNGKNYVILMHMSGSSSDEFECVGDILAERGFHTFAVDLLAFGSSDRPPHVYSMDEHANTIISFMNATGIDSAYLYGNLATANLAVHIGASYSSRVKGMLLAHPLYNPDSTYFLKKRALPDCDAIKPMADGSHLAEMWRRSTKYGSSADVSDARCCCLHQAGEWGETLHWALFEDVPLATLLFQIKAPTTVVAYSTFGEPLLLKEATAMLPNGKYDIYEGANPYIARTEPERVADMFCKYFPGAKD